MKNFILLIAVLVVGACATTPTVKSVIGTYEAKKDGNTVKQVLLENGDLELYTNGKKVEQEIKWEIGKDKEIHINGEVDDDDEVLKIVWVYRINTDRSITLIGVIDDDGKREVPPKEFLITWKKIK